MQQRQTAGIGGERPQVAITFPAYSYPSDYDHTIVRLANGSAFDQFTVPYPGAAHDPMASSRPRDTRYDCRDQGIQRGWLDVYGAEKNQTTQAGEDDEAQKAAALEGKPAQDDTAGEVPPLKQGAALALVSPPGVLAEQKFTQPPPRYNEGSLVRELEERGIGRPSTYAEIISKVQARDYVEKLDNRSFRPSTLGKYSDRVTLDCAWKTSIRVNASCRSRLRATSRRSVSAISRSRCTAAVIASSELPSTR